MIEVEKKFSLLPDDVQRLTSGAVFIAEKTIVDTYYDTPSYSLTTKDTWLRLRDQRWELKLPLRTDRGWQDQYRELQAEAEIAQALGLRTETPLATVLRAAGLAPVASVTSRRRTYRRDDFTIDLDEVDFGYRIGEIELQVEDPAEMPHAVQRINQLAQDLGLRMEPVRGKLIEYLRRFKPGHYQALRAAGVLKAL